MVIIKLIAIGLYLLLDFLVLFLSGVFTLCKIEEKEYGFALIGLIPFISGLILLCRIAEMI